MTTSSSARPAFVPGAAIRGDMLVLTLPDALNPVVWQFDLSSVKASALEVNAVGDTFALRLKTPRGEIHDIAAYKVRDQAVSVLVLVHQALVANDTKTTSSQSAGGTSAKAGSNWPLAVSVVVIFGVLLALLGFLFTPPGSAPGASQLASAPVGEAVSADDLLQQQGN